MRFVSYYLDKIDGVEIFPIISFIIFFGLFVVVVIRIATMSKSYASELKYSPLDEDTEFDTINNQQDNINL